MRESANWALGTVVVDGNPRPVDVSELPADIAAVQFDTDTGWGQVEFNGTVGVVVRDFEKESDLLKADLRIGRNGSKIEPQFKTVQVARTPQVIADFSAFQKFVEKWQAATPERV